MILRESESACQKRGGLKLTTAELRHEEHTYSYETAPKEFFYHIVRENLAQIFHLKLQIKKFLILLYDYFHTSYYFQ